MQGEFEFFLPKLTTFGVKSAKYLNFRAQIGQKYVLLHFLSTSLVNLFEFFAPKFKIVGLFTAKNSQFWHKNSNKTNFQVFQLF